MATRARQREQVGLDASAARGVGSGKAQHQWRESRVLIGRGHLLQQSRAHSASSRGRAALLECNLTPIVATRMKKYMCLICGHIYDEAVGDPDTGIPPGTKWEDVPPNWTCPDCGARKEDYELLEF